MANGCNPEKQNMPYQKVRTFMEGGQKMYVCFNFCARSLDMILFILENQAPFQTFQTEYINFFKRKIHSFILYTFK